MCERGHYIIGTMKKRIVCHFHTHDEKRKETGRRSPGRKEREQNKGIPEERISRLLYIKSKKGRQESERSEMKKLSVK
jgi:hypothetical protein